MADLIARIEAATGPDRELDRDIAIALVELETTAEERAEWLRIAEGNFHNELRLHPLKMARVLRDIDRLLGLPLPPAHGGKP